MSSVDPNKLPDPSAPPVPEDQAAPPSYNALFPSPQQQQFLPPTEDHSYVPQQSVVLETVYVSVSQQQRPQQQRQQTTRTHVESYCSHIVLACCVLWCCNWLFGIIAFAVAIIAGQTARTNGRLARILGFVSIALSLSGIVMTAIIIAVVVIGDHSESSFYHDTSNAPSFDPSPGSTPPSKCLYYLLNSACYTRMRKLCSTPIGQERERYIDADSLCHCASWEVLSNGYCYSSF